MPGALLDVFDLVEGVGGDHGKKVRVDGRKEGPNAQEVKSRASASGWPN
jgi:hypothetical protein